MLPKQITVPAFVLICSALLPGCTASPEPGPQRLAATPSAKMMLDASDRDDIANVPSTSFDEEGELPPSCVTDAEGNTVCAVFSPTDYPAAQSEAPWQASIWSFKYTNYTPEEYRVQPEWARRHKCGGTLISAQWVLTAAHCVTGKLADHPMKVRFGSTKLTDGKGVFYSVRKKVVHPNYNAAAKANDVALLQIEPVNQSGVRAVTLSNGNVATLAAQGNFVQIYGYGATRNARGSAMLMKGTVRLWGAEECAAAYTEFPDRITPSVFCANAIGTDTCQGDSGGPLMLDDRQIGIVSWGDGCAKAGKPGVYASVASYLPWITKVTGGQAGRR